MKRPEEFVYKAVEDGLFEIDDCGRIWRVARQQTSRWGYGTALVPVKRQRGEGNKRGRYLQVRVMYNGVLGIASVHRLIWFHLHGRIPAHLTVNHKDGNKKNNHPDNLELATHVEQMQHALKVCGWKPFKNGRYERGFRGEQHVLSKLTDAQVRMIRRSQKTGCQLAKELCVSPATISRVRNNTSWSHV